MGVKDVRSKEFQKKTSELGLQKLQALIIAFLYESEFSKQKIKSLRLLYIKNWKQYCFKKNQPNPILNPEAFENVLNDKKKVDSIKKSMGIKKRPRLSRLFSIFKKK